MTSETKLEFLPWLHPHWDQLLRSVATSRIPPALLIQGQRGVGKTFLAKLWAQKLLCKDINSPLPCHTCSPCQLFMAGTHPDFILVEPPEAGKSIGIDTIRQLINKLSLKPQYNGYRVVLIEPAHQLNINAANALLKTLEEPSPYTLIILVSSTAYKLPVTILSRCQKLSIGQPERGMVLHWLQSKKLRQPPENLLAIARGSPLSALALDTSDTLEQRNQTLMELSGLLSGKHDPVQLAGQWEQTFGEDRVNWMLSWVADMVSLQQDPHRVLMQNQDIHSILEGLSQSIPMVELFELWDFLLRTRQNLGGSINQRLLLEELLITWWRWRSFSAR